MKILALEFSAQLRSVAIANAESTGETHLLSLAEDADFRGVTGLMLIDRALSGAKLTPTDITHITVGIGPGSYTGIRAAIAIAQGWQLCRNVQLIGLSSVECLAEQAREAGFRGTVSVIVDAQREEIYLARYDLQSERVSLTTPLAIVKPEAVDNSETIIGPDAKRFFPEAPKTHLLSPTAAMVARLAAKSKSFVQGEQLEPIYLRATTFVKATPARTID
jgi:tRNA threonylcarbamoyladenosine biosynthesis protein TsaB